MKNIKRLQAENAILHSSLEELANVTGIEHSILECLRRAFPDRFFAKQVIEFAEKKGISVTHLLLALSPENVSFFPLIYNDWDCNFKKAK